MAIKHSPRIIMDGLVAHYDAANIKSYSGSGTVWKDLSGKGKNTTISGSPTFNSANSGSFVFDSNDNKYMKVDNSVGMFDPSVNFTVSVWLKTANSSGTHTIISRQTGNGSFQLRFVGDQNINIVKSMITGFGSFTNSEVSTNKIYNITVKKNFIFALSTSIYTCYINGTTINPDTGNAIGTITNSATFDNETNTIGRNPNGEPYAGNIYVVSAYEVALTDAQVLQNYNALKERFL